MICFVSLDYDYELWLWTDGRTDTTCEYSDHYRPCAGRPRWSINQNENNNYVQVSLTVKKIELLTPLWELDVSFELSSEFLLIFFEGYSFWVA